MKVKEKWETFKISDVCDITSSKRIYQREYKEEGVPFYRSKEIILKHHGKEISDLLYISRQRFEEIKNKFGVPKSGDILLTSVGTLGVPYLVKQNDFFYFKDGNLTWFRNFSNKIFYLYLYYWLLSNDAQGQIKSVRIGSSQSALTINSLLKLNINLPEINIQNKIASILSAYDELIENNNRRIEILEEMAETIYKEWFVYFRFPGHEKVEMVDSELGKIPEGWEAKKITDFVDFIKGFEPGSKNYFNEKFSNSIPFLRVGDLSDRKSQLWIDKNMAKGKILNKKDIALTLDGTPGIVKMGYYGAYSSGIQKAVITSKKMTWSFLYLLLKSNQIQNIIKAHSSGTTISHAGSSKKYMKFLLPKTEIMFSFEKRFSTLLYLKLFLEEKNVNLKKTRDILLPKLVSGTIDVSDLNIKIEEKK
jgi:type I restriction enzyme, S subunit